MSLALAAGLRVNYSRAGSGPPLIMLHGWANSGLTLEPLARALGEVCDTIVPDLPGHGRTEVPNDPGGWDTAAHVAFILNFMEKLKLERADFFGHSHGGRIASYLAATSPDRVGRLVLCDSAGLHERLSARTRLRRSWRRFALRSAHRLAQRGLLGSDGAERARQLSERWASADYRAAGAMRPTLAKVLADDMEPLLPRIMAPTLIVWGEQDRETPPELAERTHRLIAGSRLYVIPGAGHHPFQDQPAHVVMAITAFLLGGAP
ncbi:MAG: alpha/beta fold hydrolase [Dehalococcoidia bacterium]